MARKKVLNNEKIKGGRKFSTNKQFAKDVENRLYGGDGTQKNLPRVALSTAANTPESIVRETNRLGGRNALRMSENGTQTPHQARYRELRAALGLSTG